MMDVKVRVASQEPIPLDVTQSEDIRVKVAPQESVNLDVTQAQIVKVKIGHGFDLYDNYTGRYEVIPSAETQTLPTNGAVLTEDITIAPIPQNYGLITWNGSILTVS